MRGSAASRAAVSPGGVLAGPWVRDPLWRNARAVPSLDLRFADNKSLVDATTGQNLVTFTRASSATFVDSAGVIQTASTDVPRFNHNPTTGESLGLLVEEQRTNLLLHNRDLTQAAWVASNITPLKDQTGADGVANSASKITATDANGTILQSVTSASAARATTAYVKRLTGTGTVEMTQDNGSTWTAVTVTSAWTRASIPSATVTNPVVGFRLVTSGDAIAVDYVQCESGAFSTSAIATTTAAAATRSADVASITGTNFSSWYRQDEGTVFADVTSAPVNTIAQLTFDISEGVGNERMFQRRNASGIVATAVLDNGVTQGDVGSVVIGASARFRSAFAYKLNDLEVMVNGGGSTTDTSATIPTVDRVYIGQNFASGQGCNGTIRRLTYWPQRLSNPTLQTLTQ